MKLSDIVELQRSFDERHGFKISSVSDNEKFTQVTKDLVGLTGEVGEIANIVKKINLVLDSGIETEGGISQLEGRIGEEIADSLIYIIRLCILLRIDPEAELLKKIQRNSIKYKSHERP